LSRRRSKRKRIYMGEVRGCSVPFVSICEPTFYSNFPPSKFSRKFQGHSQKLVCVFVRHQFSCLVSRFLLQLVSGRLLRYGFRKAGGQSKESRG
jgi:hypothetical protein